MDAPALEPRGGQAAGTGHIPADAARPALAGVVERPPPGRSAIAEAAAVALRAPGAPGPSLPEVALRRLLAGNARYRAGAAAHPRQGMSRLREVVAGQHPMAMSLGCADSRVPPEILLDQGIGDLFDQRVAGNVVDETVLGSIEYAAEHLNVPLLLVLGHGGCGAVAATIAALRTGDVPGGHIGSIVESIRPAVEPVLNAADPDTPAEDVLTECVKANVAWVIGQIRTRSHIVAELVDEQRLALVPGFYDLRSGEVQLIR